MIQFDYPSCGIGRKERKRYTFSGFRGVDASVAAINVDPIRAVESTNFVDRNGVLHKRYGWEQEYQFEAEINGFWRVVLDRIAYTICYAGKTFYRLSNTDGWTKAYTSNNLVSRRTACYVQKDKAYFIGCGDLLVFRHDKESGEYKFFRVEDDEDTYIPTTTAQILPEDLVEEGLHGRYVRDGVNLLTGWRKNTLVGRVVPENGSLVYRLDAPLSINEDSKAYLTAFGSKHIFSFVENSIVAPEQGSVLEDVNAYSLKIIPHDLTKLDITECVNSTDGIDYPDVSYDAIEEEERYGDWVLKLRGENGASGLRWKRESDDACSPISPSNIDGYRTYTLCLIGDTKSEEKEVPILRRYFKNPTKKTSIIEASDYSCTISWTNTNLDSCNITVNAKKLVEEDINNEIALTIKTSCSFYSMDTKTEYHYVIIPKGESEVNLTILLTGTARSAENEVYEAYRTVDCSFELVSEEEIIANSYTIDLPSLNEKEVNLSLFSTAKTATVEIMQDNYQKVLSFYSASLICSEDGFNGKIDSLGFLSVSEWDIVENSDIANVEVKFYVNPKNVECITSCKYSTLYGVGGEADRLFVANGNDKSKSNIIFFSEMNDFSYFPDNFTKSVGGNANEVQGFIRLSNGSMAVLKTLQRSEPTVFVFNGEYISGYYDAEEEEPYMLPRFSTIGTSTTQGIIAPYACSNLADDSLFLSQNGVYALELSHGTDSQRFAKERSLPINNLLNACNLSELKNACAITHGNKYYLAVKHYKKTVDKTVIEGKIYYEKTEDGYIVADAPDADLGMSRYYEQEDCVYVADAHYSFIPAGAMSDAPSYEWYPLTNIPVRLWFLLDGELYFGTEDGQVCRFIKNQYYDVKKIFYASSTALTKKAAKYSQTLPKAITPCVASATNRLVDTFAVDENSDIESGDSIIFLSGFIRATVHGNFTSLLNKELYIVKKEDGNLQLKYSKDDEECLVFSLAINLVAAVLKKQVVKATRTLPTFDFGMPDYLKSLESFTVAMNGVEGGSLSLDIYTRNNQQPNQNVKGQAHFNSIEGFGKMSFNVPFQNSYTKKICVRNFNYAIFRIYNETPVDCSVASISVYYKYNRASGGIR